MNYKFPTKMKQSHRTELKPCFVTVVTLSFHFCFQNALLKSLLQATILTRAARDNRTNSHLQSDKVVSRDIMPPSLVQILNSKRDCKALVTLTKMWSTITNLPPTTH